MQLHSERVDPVTRRQLHHRALLDELPDGSFVLRDGVPWLVAGSQLVRWTAAGYVDPSPRPSGEDVVLITPPSLVAILSTGWRWSRAVAPLVRTGSDPTGLTPTTAIHAG